MGTDDGSGRKEQDPRVAVLIAEAERRSLDGDAASAVACLEAAVDLAPEDAAALNRLARALHACGRTAEAADAHGRSLRRATAPADRRSGRIQRGIGTAVVRAVRAMTRRRTPGE